MKTLVIHPKDVTTDFLSVIYADNDWTVINTNVSKFELKKQIKAHDRIIMLGHGTQDGLIGFKHLVIDSTYVYLLRNKLCICIWCNADMFVRKYELNGFYTGMIISELDEAEYYMTNVHIDEMNSAKFLADLKTSNELFASSIAKHIDSDNILELVIESYNKENNKIIDYNIKNIYKNE